MKRHAALTSTYSNTLDTDGTLTAQSLSKAHREPRRGVARGVLVAIGIALCIMPNAGSSDIDAPKEYIDYKTYALYLLDWNHKEHRCLLKLYGKESAWNPDAVGNLNGSQRVYGIPQGKSDYLARVDGYKQIQWGLKYIDHRYGMPCDAWQAFQEKGWH